MALPALRRPVGRFHFNGSLRQYCSLYWTVYQKKRERKRKKERENKIFVVVVVVALLFYVHGKHLRSSRDGQLT